MTFCCLVYEELEERVPSVSVCPLTQLCPLVLRDPRLPLRQFSADVVDLGDGVAVFEPREVSTVFSRLVVDFGVVGAAGFLELVEEEGDFGGGEGLFVGHVAEFEARGGFFVAGGGWTAPRCWRRGCAALGASHGCGWDVDVGFGGCLERRG